MAVESTMLPLGTELPAFSLPDTVSGETINSESLRGRPCLVTVICNHCPFVVHIKEELPRLAQELIDRGVTVVAVSSNDAERFEADGPDKMKADAEKHGYPFPYLYDEEQSLAANLQAMCTPEFYLFDDESKLVYRGRLDDSSPGNGKPVTGAEVRGAVDALLEGKPPVDPQLPSVGCSVKWKPGRTPDYFQS